VLESDWNFYQEKNEFDAFTPIKEIQRTVDIFVKRFSRRTIGVHIRRTDHQISIDSGPIEMFVAAMSRRKQQDNDIKFFVASDDPAAIEYIMVRFPQDVIRYEGARDRISEQGVVGGVIDLYCLAATDGIIGSYWSSFSETASLIGNIPLEIVRKDGILNNSNLGHDGRETFP
jgi:hypothetical protein